MANITIDFYSDSGFSKSSGPSWTGNYDPSDLKVQFSNRFLDSNSIGISAPPTYAGEASRNMTFPLIFDNGWYGALTTVPAVVPTIKSQVDSFMKMVHKVNSESHSVNYLKITCGDFIFCGQTQSVNVNYQHFNREGKPLKAVVNLTITQTESVSTKKAAAGLQSPDLTRSVMVREGDSLAGISQKFYNTPDYYLELARFNGIADIRKLKPGTRIMVPPLES